MLVRVGGHEEELGDYARRMQSSITVNGVEMPMSGVNAMKTGMVIDRIIRAGDTRELRIRGADADGSPIVLVTLITPASSYAVTVGLGEEEVQEALSGTVGERLEENVAGLAAEYGFLDAEGPGDSHESTS